MQRAFTFFFRSTLPLATLGCLIPLTAEAQVTADGTTATTVNRNGDDFTIEKGDRLGDNLFHSFDEFSVPTLAKGNAGDLTVDASQEISLTNGLILASVLGAQAVGKGGNVTLNTPNLSLSELGQISVFTGGQGDAGDLTVDASQEISLNGGLILAGVSEAPVPAVGKGGNVTLNTPNLSLSEGGVISVATEGRGDAGSLDINASSGTVTVKGENSSILAQVINTIDTEEPITNTRQGGSVNIDTGTLQLTDNGQISLSTVGEGNAGDLTVNASQEISLTNSGAFSKINSSGVFSGVARGSVGNGGDINITTRSLSLIDGALLSSSTFEQGDAGKITITANTLTATGDSTIQTNTASSGKAGDITLKIEDSFNLTGSTIEASTSSESSGKGGSIIIDPDSVILNDNSAIAVNSQGTGGGGNIFLTADNLTLNNNSEISAATVSGEGGNIDLAISEDIFFKNNSSISARASGNADGGNVTINADDGSIVAFPNQDNDIIANAEQGNGGNIDITTQAIFGMEERRSVPKNTTNDIDVSSEFGLQGNTSLNTLEVDPTSGLIELPEAVGDASDQISQNPCEQGIGSEFTITGKGGIPPNSNETLNSDTVRVGLVEPVPSRQGGGQTEILGEDNNNSTPSEQLVPAQGWVFTDEGKVMLTAYQTTDITTQRDRSTPNSCSTLQQK